VHQDERGKAAAAKQNKPPDATSTTGQEPDPMLRRRVRALGTTAGVVTLRARLNKRHLG
jgi:hypothetical protein